MQKLKIFTIFLEKLKVENIVYCHWKSNDHVKEGLYGITDLDILIQKSQRLEFQSVLTECGFKRCKEGFGTNLPAVEGYIGMDKETGKMAYIHLHYQLVLGKNRIKEYCVRWKNIVLNSRKYDTDADIYVIDPDIEMILLVLRASLKIRWRDIIINFLGKKFFRDNWINQYNWLKDRIDKDKSSNICKSLLGENAFKLYKEIISGQLDVNLLLKFKSFAKERIILFRVYPPLTGCLIMWLKEIYGFFAFINRKYFNRKLPLIRKGISTGGIFFVLIGPDGAGKSTISREITSLLSWKLDVYNAYLGAGDGQTSLLRWPLLRLLKLLEMYGFIKPKSQKKLSQHSIANESITSISNMMRSIAKTIWALILSYEKRKKLKAAWRACHQGVIVISDRYPQAQIMGFNDGPLLSAWLKHQNRLLQNLAKWEIKPYLMADQNPPDTVIRLNVSPAIAKGRDPNMSLDFLKKRIDAIDSLTFGHRTAIFDVDADRELDSVLLDIKNIIWNNIQ